MSYGRGMLMRRTFAILEDRKRALALATELLGRASRLRRYPFSVLESSSQQWHYQNHGFDVRHGTSCAAAIAIS